MMKKKCFDLRLYLEGLRQLRLLGLLFTIGVGLLVIFIPVGEFFASADMPTLDAEARAVSYAEMNPLMSLAFCFVAPFLTLNAFSFLNKRESDDFYHALPATRTCLFFCFFAAVVTWLFIFVFGTALLSGLFHSFFPSLFIIDWAGVFQMSLNCFVGGLLVAAAVAVAMSVTGTPMMNVLVSLLIIFLPRILIQLITNAIAYTFPLVDGLSFLPLLSTPCNIPANFVLQFTFYSGDESLLTSWTALFYTLALAVIYSGIALWLFNKRRSEGAGQSAPTPKLQAFFRFLIGFTFTSIITLTLYSDVLNSYYYGGADLIGWLFLYVLAIFAMVVFEIICTRRFRGLIRRCLVTIGVLIAANLLLAGGVFAIGTGLRAYEPDTEDITSVRVLEFGSGMSGYATQNYFEEKAAEIDITDFAVRQMVSDQLQHTLKAFKTSPREYYEQAASAHSMVVSIKSGGIHHQRRIMVYENNLQLLGDVLAKNKAYQDVYMNLPTQYNHVRSDDMMINRSEGADTIVSTLQAEIREIGFAKWYALISGVDTNDIFYAEKYPDKTVTTRLTTLYIIVSENAVWKEIAVPLDASVLPKTVAAYIEVANRINASGRKILLETLIERPEECEHFEYLCFNTVTDENGNTSHWFDEAGVLKSKAEIAAFVKKLEENADAPIDPTKPLCFVSITRRVPTEYNYSDYVYYCGYFAIPDGAAFPLSGE